MPGIGDSLREARMRQRLDIADAEARTKIRAKYLRALENEEFGLLPGSTFVKTFLRTYAEVLGLDPHRLVEDYKARYEREELEPASLAPTPAAPGRERRFGGGGGGGPGGGTVLAAIVVGVLGLLLLIGLLGGDENDGGQEAAQTGTAERERRPARERPRRPRPVARRVTLAVTPSVPTYVCVDHGPGTDISFEGIIQDRQTFNGGRRLRVNLGKTSVQMTVNGRTVPIVQGPNPAGFEFTPGGRRELPVGQRPCA